MIKQDLRDVIIAEPEVVLEDRDVMAALIAANERAMGANIIDLRGIAMERMEARLDRLEDTHRSVIAAAYENLAGTNQVHRAILQMLEPVTFEAFVHRLGAEVAQTLRVDCVRLVLESVQPADDPAVRRLGETLCVTEPGFVAAYTGAAKAVSPRPVTLRQTIPASDRIYGERAGWIRSEALLRLDLGQGRLPGLLVLGAEDPHRFRAAQGTDLLAFFGGVFERSMRRWLA
jgi:uncharacterized protein YigA (DUF484 family)